MVTQLRAAIADDGAFTQLVSEYEQASVGDEALGDDLRTALRRARLACSEMAAWFEQQYLPAATERDAVGEERYARHAKAFLGTELDLAETYRWGWDHLMELWSEMHEVAGSVDPDRDLPGVVELLESDPSRCESTQEGFRQSMLERSREALADLDGTHFEIPEPIKQIDVRLAPKGSPLGAYYIAPSEDFSRCGTTWWSLGDAEPVPVWDDGHHRLPRGFPRPPPAMRHPGVPR